MDLSVIIPTLSEAARIDRCLGELAAQPGIGEILVVDGGSDDDTAVRAARHPGVRVLSASRGRARQQNAGAAAARGDVLLFLHADVVLPEGAAATIEATLSRPGVVAGAFRTRHVAEAAWRGRRRAGLLRLADLRSRYASLPYGDQAIFVGAETLAQIGGFPDQALMEDLELSRRLARRGRIAIAGSSVRVSGRRFESAPLYQGLLVNAFPMLYALGVPATVLEKLYGNPR